MIEIEGIIHKECPHCGRMLPISYYSKSNTSANGYRSWCKECINSNRYSELNKLKCKEYYSQRGKELNIQNKLSNIQKYLYQSAKARAKQKGEIFDIDLTDIEVPEVCPIFGIPMQYHREVKQDNSYSLDRIDSSKGYVKGNVWVISLRANRIKNDSTPQELRLIADKVEERLHLNKLYKEE